MYRANTQNKVCPMRHRAVLKHPRVQYIRPVRLWYDMQHEEYQFAFAFAFVTTDFVAQTDCNFLAAVSALSVVVRMFLFVVF